MICALCTKMYKAEWTIYIDDFKSWTICALVLVAAYKAFKHITFFAWRLILLEHGSAGFHLVGKHI
jgi:hypothetical protein